jgi:hypothetical protein
MVDVRRARWFKTVNSQALSSRRGAYPGAPIETKYSEAQVRRGAVPERSVNTCGETAFAVSDFEFERDYSKAQVRRGAVPERSVNTCGETAFAVSDFEFERDYSKAQVRRGAVPERSVNTCGETAFAVSEHLYDVKLSNTCRSGEMANTLRSGRSEHLALVGSSPTFGRLWLMVTMRHA